MVIFMTRYIGPWKAYTAYRGNLFTMDLACLSPLDNQQRLNRRLQGRQLIPCTSLFAQWQLNYHPFRSVLTLYLHSTILRKVLLSRTIISSQLAALYHLQSQRKITVCEGLHEQLLEYGCLDCCNATRWTHGHKVDHAMYTVGFWLFILSSDQGCVQSNKKGRWGIISVASSFAHALPR